MNIKSNYRICRDPHDLTFYVEFDYDTNHRHWMRLYGNDTGVFYSQAGAEAWLQKEMERPTIVKEYYVESPF